MNEKNISNLRFCMACLGALAALFALVGSIGTLASIETNGEAFTVFWDFARISGACIFSVDVIALLIEYLSLDRKIGVPIIVASTSALGFVGTLISCLKGFQSGTGGVVVGSIFIMVAAVGACIPIVMVVVRKVSEQQKNANPYNYGYPNQQYPQQFPQQFPQQGVPVQPVQQPVQPVQPVQQPVYTAPAPAPMPAPAPIPAPAAAQLSPWTCSCGTVNSAEAKFCKTCGSPRQ